MNKIRKFCACAVMLICAGCGNGDDESSDYENSEYSNSEPSIDDYYKWQEKHKMEPTMSEICEEYKKHLTRFLTIRKKREGLSYSVNGKVAEEMARFRGLSQSDKKEKLNSLKRQLEDFQ
jgi:hypothetical protein